MQVLLSESMAAPPAVEPLPRVEEPERTPPVAVEHASAGPGVEGRTVEELQTALHACSTDFDLKLLRCHTGTAGCEDLWGVREDLRQQYSSLNKELFALLMHVCAGGGKSKVAPSELRTCHEAPFLVLTTIRREAKEMSAKASVPSYWQVGGSEWGGDLVTVDCISPLLGWLPTG